MQTKQDEGRQCCSDQAVVALISTDHESAKEENTRRGPEEVRPEMEVYEKGHQDNDDDGYKNNNKTEYFGGFDKEADHLMNIVGPAPADSCLTSSDDWGGFKSDTNLLDQSNSNYPCWDFWS
ncbi:unnamed protein product [Eruca vesicaria subsp. sativa]|uniref:Uncharacterized protein n=1 Tax=Eruca vesicaria subsp. sativa TaxID=29727 RepID=A0ABC8IR75_ERUVS|nr:unnamed protein product [Eruca vesicaria subsp. sativa]